MGTSLRLFDTLTSNLQSFVSRTASNGGARPVGIYCCGPTVYDVAHVGHARAALAPDILVRHLRAEGLAVKYVRNITDVDDKILARSKERSMEPLALSGEMAALYQTDMRALGCLAPDVEPKVSEHIPHIIELVEKLIAQEVAYVAVLPDGTRDVYYRVRKFAGYGKLSKRKIEDLLVGARIEANDVKEDPLDFALWKGADSAAWGWPSPWGKGRPGWHIECSAMSACHLGHGFDIHAGGMDLIFPHHENEIAQSEGAFPEDGPFARTWIHNGFVNVDKEKMAKSLGNFVTIRQVFERNDPEALRYFLLTVHYRGPIAFDTDKLESGRVIFPSVVEAERRVDYLYQTLERLGSLSQNDVSATLTNLPFALRGPMTIANEAGEKLRAALDDDLNTPVALSVLGELAKSANELCDVAIKKAKDPSITSQAPHVASRMSTVLRELAGRLGLLEASPADYRARTRAQRLTVRGLTEAQIEEKVAGRNDARGRKDFAEADRLRGELTSLGVEIFDTSEGTTWRLLAQ